MKKKLLKLFVLLLIVFIGVNISAAAQSLRSPTQKERQAIDKVVRTVMPIISSFANKVALMIRKIMPYKLSPMW
ncbi:MAG TPA: hypothetical protein PLU27_08005 [Ginsengibacter sp.]|nr:hypothetical protein [Ginsengibacter sp.]